MLMANGYYQPFWVWPAVLGAIATIVALVWILDRVIKHYFPSTRKYYRAGGNALMRVDAMFLPGREHIIEAQEREYADEDEKGEPPIPGSE